MVPSDLKPEQFNGYPPEGRKLITGYVGPLQRLPLSFVPSLLREPGTVDERRATMSLGPLAEYVAQLTEFQGPPGPVIISLSCPRCEHGIEVELGDPDEGTAVECAGCGLTFRVSPAGPDAGPASPAGPGDATP